MEVFQHFHSLTPSQQQEFIRRHAIYQQQQQLMSGQYSYNQDISAIYRQQGLSSGGSNSRPGPLNGNASTSGKRGKTKAKRIRTIFTPEQLKRLEQEFTNQMYLVGDDRVYLARSLGLNENQVKVWFQNRRIKFRKIQVQKIQPKSKHKNPSNSQ